MNRIAPLPHIGTALAAPLPLDPTMIGEPRIWAGLAPSLHVCNHSFMRARSPLRIRDDVLHTAVSAMLREGYLQLPPMDWALPLSAMIGLVRWLASLGAPPVLAYHFDEFRMMFAQMQTLLCALLGDDPVMLPEFWAWHVDPKAQEAGWAPHRDRGHTSLLPDGSPKVVTLWLPLTDATPLNGCMYIVPADRDPTYGTAATALHPGGYPSASRPIGIGSGLESGCVPLGFPRRRQRCAAAHRHRL
jgi:hypothetical protein